MRLNSNSDRLLSSLIRMLRWVLCGKYAAMNFLINFRVKRSVRKCKGCKYLYSEGIGFANDHRSGTRVSCAMNHQADLPKDLPLMETVEVLSTTILACDLYAPGRHVSLDVLGYEGASLYSRDLEQVDAITIHSKRPRVGQPHSWALANLILIQADV